ncbi:hypothetical protein SHPE106448_05820 [Shewanella pealeana]
MNVKYLTTITTLITLIAPLTALFIVNNIDLNLSQFQTNSVNFVCSAILLVTLIDIVLIAFKRHKAQQVK